MGQTQHIPGLCTAHSREGQPRASLSGVSGELGRAGIPICPRLSLPGGQELGMTGWVTCGCLWHSPEPQQQQQHHPAHPINPQPLPGHPSSAQPHTWAGACRRAPAAGHTLSDTRTHGHCHTVLSLLSPALPLALVTRGMLSLLPWRGELQVTSRMIQPELLQSPACDKLANTSFNYRKLFPSIFN